MTCGKIETREDYQKAAETVVTVHAMKVVNDHADCGVALIPEFSQ